MSTLPDDSLTTRDLGNLANPADPAGKHRRGAPASVRCAVVTVSTSRTAAQDETGPLIRRLLDGGGHVVKHYIIIKDDAVAIKQTLELLVGDDAVQAVIFNGGTGLSMSDITVETIAPLFGKTLTAFQAAFTALSWHQVGAACILSRATAGVYHGRIIFCLPGSPKACKLAMESLIIPELGHILRQIGEV